MQYAKKRVGNFFFGTTVLGLLFLLVEMLLQASGRSICVTEGCRVVSRNARYGDISILLIGIATFAGLAGLSFLALYRERTQCEKYINILLIVSLSSEGFFTGYQAFRAHTACIFCLITFAFIVVLGLLRLLYGEKDVIAGFLSFAAVFALFYLILPVGNTVRLPEDEMVLFYSKDCKYCTMVMEEMEKNNIKALHLPVGDYSGFLKGMGIEHVPVLYVNKKNRELFLTGREEITQYLFCKPEEALKKPEEPASKTETLKKAGQQKGTVSKGHSEQIIPDLNNRGLLVTPPGTLPGDLFVQPPDEGMCKETEKCD